MVALLFLLIITAWYAVYRQWSKVRVVSLGAVTLMVTVVLLNHRAASALDLSF